MIITLLVGNLLKYQIAIKSSLGSESWYHYKNWELGDLNLQLFVRFRGFKFFKPYTILFVLVHRRSGFCVLEAHKNLIFG